jgi:hypothetical protein
MAPKQIEDPPLASRTVFLLIKSVWVLESWASGAGEESARTVRDVCAGTPEVTDRASFLYSQALY